MVDAFAAWLKTTQLSGFAVNYPWVWPAAETLHFIGLCLLMGVIGLVDLRMLGMMKRIPFSTLHRLVPWGIAGFVINLLTGILFFAGVPEQYVHNIAFQFKVLFIALAGLNVMVFYLTVYRHAEALGPGDDAPFSVKCVAGVSMFLWIGVMYLGRMLPYIGNSF